MSDLEFLTKTREKLASGWCQYKHAQDGNGNVTYPENQRATAWCVSGAVMAAGGLVFGSAHNAIRDLLPVDSTVTHWNDQPGRTQTEVLELLDRAIAKARHE